MENAIGALNTTITANALWSEFASTLPFVGTVALFAFGYYIIRKLIKGVSKGKARI